MAEREPFLLRFSDQGQQGLRSVMVYGGGKVREFEKEERETEQKQRGDAVLAWESGRNFLFLVFLATKETVKEWRNSLFKASDKRSDKMA